MSFPTESPLWAENAITEPTGEANKREISNVERSEGIRKDQPISRPALNQILSIQGKYCQEAKEGLKTSGAMPKATFDANRGQRNRESAGSGFTKWGNHHYLPNTLPNINEGMYQLEIEARYANSLTLGLVHPEIDKDGISRTTYPIVVVDGVRHNLSYVNNTTKGNKLLFPPAPDGTKTYDSATSGGVTQHASSNEAFEGLVQNGDFRLGDSGTWIKGTNWSIIAGSAVSNGVGVTSKLYQDVGLVVGTRYRIEIACELTSGNFVVQGHNGSYVNIGTMNQSGVYVFEYTPTDGNNGRLYIESDVSDIGSIFSVSVMPVTESVITSRKDLAFLETWHEEIVDKVYYLGSVQSYLVNPYGITSITRSDGYTRFGEWDTTTTGEYCDWSTMTDAQKLLFVQDPENNIYVEDGKYYQVRYRIRVIEGLGDEWGNINPFRTDSGHYFAYNTNVTATVIPRGIRTTFTDLSLSGGFPTYAAHSSSQTAVNAVGTFDAISWVGTPDSDSAHDGKCFAVPIALVQRLNQGAYHPSYNPQGCANFMADTSGSPRQWYHANIVGLINSESDCFNRGGQVGNVATDTGYIGSPQAGFESGRSDQYEFYDAIYAGLVEDLRLNENKLDLNRLLEDSIRSDVAGTTRGKGKVPFTYVNLNTDTVWTSSGAFSGFKYLTTPYWPPTPRGSLSDGDSYHIYNETLNAISTPSTTMLDGSVAGSRDNFYVPESWGDSDTMYIVEARTLSAEYDSLPYVNLTGTPQNLALTFPDGVVGEWIPNDYSVTVNDHEATRKISSAGSSLQYTGNNGLTWDTTNRTANQTRNTIPFGLASVHVAIHTYESLSDHTEPSPNSKVLGQLGDVYISEDARTTYGNRLQPSLTGLIGKDPANVAHPSSEYKALTSTGLVLDGRLGFNSSIGVTAHQPTSIGSPDNDGPAVKSLLGLTEKDGLIYPIYWGSELKHDATSFIPWGDDSTIPIIDNTGTATNLNNETVKTFCHIGKIPLGIANYNDGGI